MKIYAIGDLHLSGKPPSKPREIVGKHWTDHAAKVAANWHQLIRSDDTVIICGIAFLEESFYTSEAVGGALIIAGVYLTTQYRLLAYKLARYLVKRRRQKSLNDC